MSRVKTKPRASKSGLPPSVHVALVAGATRGAGRGVARALGELRATVYCTGRSVRGAPSSYGRPETIEETAELVTAAGGRGIAVRVDHTRGDEVRELVARIAADEGRLDVLATSVAGEDPTIAAWTKFLESDLSRAATAFEQTITSHLLTAQHAARLMAKQRRGLIVEVTSGDTILGGSGGNLLAEIAKTAQKVLVHVLAEELRGKGITVVAVTPGYLRSEAMLARYGVSASSWRDAAKKDPDFLQSETPLFIGRAIAALATDPARLERSGEITSSWELARRYGVTDEDGSRPDWGRHFATLLPSMPWLRTAFERHLVQLELHAQRVRESLRTTPAAMSES